MVGVLIVVDVVMDPGEGFVLFFRDHLVIGGVEMGGECDKDDYDTKGERDKGI